jgi:hypothetical protein
MPRADGSGLRLRATLRLQCGNSGRRVTAQMNGAALTGSGDRTMTAAPGSASSSAAGPAQQREAVRRRLAQQGGRGKPAAAYSPERRRRRRSGSALARCTMRSGGDSTDSGHELAGKDRWLYAMGRMRSSSAGSRASGGGALGLTRESRGGQDADALYTRPNGVRAAPPQRNNPNTTPDNIVAARRAHHRQIFQFKQ